MNIKKIFGTFIFSAALFSVNAHAELPQALANELAAEVQSYEKLYQDKRGQEIFDYVDKTVLNTMAERAKFPALVDMLENTTISMAENTDKLAIQMDLANAQSDVSSGDIPYAIIPYVMTIDDTSLDGKMLVMKTNGKWTFSRFDEQNSTMINTLKEIYPSLKFDKP